MQTVLNRKQSILYCPRNIKTGEYVTERYEPAEDIFEAIGWNTPELCKRDIATFDEPDEWEVAKKITTMIMVKEEVNNENTK